LRRAAVTRLQYFRVEIRFVSANNSMIAQPQPPHRPNDRPPGSLFPLRSVTFIGVAIGLLHVSGTILAGSPEQNTRSPNVLFIIADDK
jgi:hypothetical protein